MKPTPFKSALILSAYTLMSLSTLARADVFGIPGAPGAAGSNGYSGANGQSVSVVASGQPQNFNLRGQDGGNGGNGQPGGHAQECRQPPPVRADFFGAPGGSGGNGGYGGNGGSGGSVTVYYSDIANLKQISVDATPGRGGNAGYGANGDNGCGCERHEWFVPVQVCHQENPPVHHDSFAQADTGHGAPAPGHSNPPAPGPKPAPAPQPEPKPVPQPQPAPAPVPPPQPITVCETVPERHVCVDGRSGDNGSNFSGGSAGQYGSATLNQSLTPLTPTNPSASAQVGSLPSQTTLTTDNWASAPGAGALFAPGSQISDTYQYWAGRKTVQTSVVWNASTPQSSCTSQAIGVQVNGAGQVSANIENGTVWAQLSVNYAADGSATVSVDKAVPANEATQLAGSISGSDSGLVEVLNDAAKVSTLVDTQIQAKVSTPGFLGIMTSRFNGVVPANMLSVNDSSIVIDIGKLPGLPSGDIKKGKKVKIELTVTRSLGGQSANQQINIEQKI
jgi:hypothetical protein